MDKEGLYWDSPEAVVNAVAEVAPAQRTFMRQLMETLEKEGVDDSRDRLAFLAEVLAAQVNLMVDMLEVREQGVLRGRPSIGRDNLTNLAVSDIMNRAVLRRLRGEDR